MPTTTPERRLRVLAGITLLTFALTGCTDKNPHAAAPQVTGTATALVNGYPGLYYDASAVSVVADGPDLLQLVGQMSCTTMDAMLSAGQWRVVDRLSLPTASSGLGTLTGIVPGLILQRGTTLAFAALKGERQFCTATVTHIQDAGIALTGDGLPGATQGWAATTACVRIGKDSLTVSLFFDTTAKVGGLITVPLTEKNGAYTAEGASGDLNILLLRHTSHVLETFTSTLTAQEGRPGVTLSSPEPGDDFAGTATVDSGSPDRPRGSLSLSGLVGESTGEQIKLDLPFACPTVTVIASASTPG